MIFVDFKACGHRTTIVTLYLYALQWVICVFVVPKEQQTNTLIVNIYLVHTSIHMYITIFIVHNARTYSSTQSLITKNKMFILSGSFMANCGNCLHLGQYHAFAGLWWYFQLQAAKIKPPPILSSCCRSQLLRSAKLFANTR